MATIIHIQGHSKAASKEPSKFLAYYHNLINELEGVYFGLISMTIAIGSAIGGISLMYAFENHAPIWQAIIGISLSLINNIVAILQLNTRWVLDIFILNIIVNGILIAINAF
jgi:hypothetical protein